MTVPNTIDLKRIDGTDTRLADYAGKVLLVVNVASKCGLTPQYEALEREYESLKDRGFVVLGFPCNQFRGQEPGDESEIQAFCATTYGVSKVEVNGPGRHPLYRALVEAAPIPVENPDGGMRARLAQHGVEVPKGDVMWNFEKFLIGRDGTVVARFAPDITVDDPRVRDAIDAALAA
jgi:glutathione peroxidase